MTDATGSPDPLLFDLVIVGGGSGNSIISREFSHLSIALIDDGDHFGGTCLNAGCIPTKMFVHVADVAFDALHAGPLGLTVERADAHWLAIRNRIFTRTDALSDAGFTNRDVKIANVTVFRETFAFTAPHELVGASGVRIRGARIVIAAGSRPRSFPAIAAVSDYDNAAAAGIHNSDSIMRIEKLPASLVIVGGGAVGVEFAHVFSALGVAVSQVVRAKSLLAGATIDSDVATAFTEQAATQWTVITGATVESLEGVSPDPVLNGREAAEHSTPLHRIRLDNGTVLETEAILVALGRIPNTDTLGLGAVGFDLHPDGRLAVDEHQRVLCGGAAVEGIFALGDVSSAWQLKHVANHQARIVQHNLLHADDLIGGDPGPVVAAIFSRPQVAWFGLTSTQAPDDAVVVRREYGTTAWGWALEDTKSFCTLVVDRSSGALLGAHILGPEASILIQPLVMAASLGLAVPGLARSMYWPHPAATEIVENALLDAGKLLSSTAAHRPASPVGTRNSSGIPQPKASTTS